MSAVECRRQRYSTRPGSVVSVRPERVVSTKSFRPRRAAECSPSTTATVNSDSGKAVVFMAEGSLHAESGRGSHNN